MPLIKQKFWASVRLHGFFVLLLGLAGCFAPTLDTISAIAVARDPMRRLQTEDTVLYYPANQPIYAQSLAKRLQGCFDRLKTHLVDKSSIGRTNIILHTGELNNAYVTPNVAGQPLQMVLPLHEGLELFNLFNIGVADVDYVSCHEALHYLVFTQNHGLWGFVNRVFGDVVAPNASLDLWFHEGMATYYEGHLAGPVGRPESLLWRGMFQAGVTKHRSSLQQSYLSPYNRELGAVGGHYLIGLHFIEYLVQRFGEQRLWELVDLQSRSWLPFLNVDGRFRQVYGQFLTSLFNDFVESLHNSVPDRFRPVEQTDVLPAVGNMARLGSCPSKHWLAVAHQSPDLATHLTLYDDTTHTVLWSHLLTDILPGRDHVVSSTNLLSGLSFSQDCRNLYFTAADYQASTEYTSHLWRVDTHTGAMLQSWPLFSGLGGGVDAQGQVYVYVQLVGHDAQLMQLDLKTGARVQLLKPAGTTSLGAPVVSPNGQMLVFSARTQAGFNLFVQYANKSQEALTHDAAFNYDARWLDNQHIIFMRNEQNHLQAFVLNIFTKKMQRITDAPYALLDPVPLDNTHVAFLNAEGWGWSVDKMLLRQPINQTDTAVAGVAATASTDLADASAPIATSTWLEKPLQIEEDTAYSGFDHLLVPNLRAPILQLQLSDAPSHDMATYWSAFAVLIGHDRLGWHNYMLQAGYDSLSQLPVAALAYLNQQWMPWQAFLQASFTADHTTQTWYSSLSLSRPLWTSTVEVNLQGLDSQANQVLHTHYPHYRLWGPGLLLHYSAYDGTPYAGANRALVLSVASQIYPKALGNTADLADLRAVLGVTLPLPLSVRHTLSLGVRGRALVNTDVEVLRSGGVSPGAVIADAYNLVGSTATPTQTLHRYNNAAGFYESFRGYEDIAVLANQVILTDITYNYPLILDYGRLSVFYIFPSLLIPQINFQIFHSAVFLSKQASIHPVQAVGASMQLHTIWASAAGINLMYQIAYRIHEPIPAVYQFLSLVY